MNHYSLVCIHLFSQHCIQSTRHFQWVLPFSNGVEHWFILQRTFSYSECNPQSYYRQMPCWPLQKVGVNHDKLPICLTSIELNRVKVMFQSHLNDPKIQNVLKTFDWLWPMLFCYQNGVKYLTECQRIEDCLTTLVNRVSEKMTKHQVCLYPLPLLLFLCPCLAFSQRLASIPAWT